MSTNYNLRVEALRHFRLSGMIWYQGESDINWSCDAYSRAFDLLQQSYTEHFKHDNGLLPIVFTQLASYFYSDEGWVLPARNVDFSEIQQKQPESRALTPIYDVPLTYIPEAGVIHPESKLEVGERMAYAAICFESEDYFEGTASLKINTVSNHFKVIPVFDYESDYSSEIFYDADTDYSEYGKISLYIKITETMMLRLTV